MRRKLFGYSRSDSKSDGFLMPPEIHPKTARKLLKRAVNQFCFLKFSGRFRADFRTDFRADFRAQFRAHRSGSIFKFSGEPFLDQLGDSFWLSCLGLNTACESQAISTSLWKSTVAPNLFKLKSKNIAKNTPAKQFRNIELFEISGLRLTRCDTLPITPNRRNRVSG